MHIYVGNLTIIGSDNGLSPERRQAIIWTNAGILSIGPLGINFNEISIGIQTFSFKKMRFKMSSAKWRPFCLGLNVLTLVVLILFFRNLKINLHFLSILSLDMTRVVEILFYGRWGSIYATLVMPWLLMTLRHKEPSYQQPLYWPSSPRICAIFTNPTMHQSHIPQRTIQNRNVHISVLNGALWDMGKVHCGICATGLLWLHQQ